MNKTEVTEIKKIFKKDDNGITRICGCYVDGEKNKRVELKEAFYSLPEEEMFKYVDIFRKTMSGTLGKNLMNMEFPMEEETNDDGKQKFMMKLVDSGLQDDALLDEFYDMVIKTYEYTGNYLIVLIHTAYDIPSITADGIENEDASDYVYNFILCSICPVKLSKAGLCYNPENNSIEDCDRDWIVQAPDAGFLFPAFNDRNTDLHSMLYYTRNPEVLQPEANGFYALMEADGTSSQNYRDAFFKAYFERQNNTELLISTRVIGKFNNDWWYKFQTEFVGYGNYTPTLEYMQMFPMSDGTPFDSNTLLADGAFPFFTDNDYNKPVRDPRLYETMLVNGANFGDHAAELWLGGRDNIDNTEKETGKVATGFSLYKFYKTGNLSGTYPQWPYLRLVEVYLIYAEAILHAKGDLQKAIDQVDIVRARVGLGGLAKCNPTKNLTTDKNALLEEILRERACELGLEDVRFFDMIRYKRADLFQKKLHGLKVYRNDGGGNKPWSGTSGNASEYPNKPSNFKYEVFELKNIARTWWSNFNPKWYLAAFPPSEVNKGYGLTQNPGWK